MKILIHLFRRFYRPIFATIVAITLTTQLSFADISLYTYYGDTGYIKTKEIDKEYDDGIYDIYIKRLKYHFRNENTAYDADVERNYGRYYRIDVEEPGFMSERHYLPFDSSTNGVVNCGTDTSLNFGNNFTLAVRARINIGGGGYLISKRDGNQSQYGMAIAPDTGRLLFVYGDKNNPKQIDLNFFSEDWRDGEWHEFAITVKQSSPPSSVWVTGYVDGVAYRQRNTRYGGLGGFWARRSYNGITAFPDVPVLLGARGDGNGGYDYILDGAISDTKVYGRSLLSSEIQALWVTGDVTEGLAAHWDCQEGQGTVLQDKVGNNNGVINGLNWARTNYYREYVYLNEDDPTDGKLQSSCVKDLETDAFVEGLENEYDISGNLIAREEYGDTYRQLRSYYYDADDNLISWNVDGYDAYGNWITRVTYDASDNVTQSLLYEYDEAGNRVNHIYYDAQGNLDHSYTLEYNRNGDYVAAYDYDSAGNVTGRRVFTYNAAGQQEYTYWYDASDNLSQSLLYEYDEAGNRVNHIYYDASGNVDNSYTLEYDSEGQYTVARDYDSTGSLTGSRTFAYDSQGNNTGVNFYDASGNLTQSSITGYDNNGNIVDQYYYDSDGVQTSHSSREYSNKECDITYHPTERVASRTLVVADDKGNIYYEYIDENWNSQGFGRILISQLAEPNENGEIAFEYEYYPGTDEPHYVYSYSDTLRNSLVATYTYDVNGNITNIVYPYATKQLTTSALWNITPEIDGSQITWLGHSGDDYEVFYYNGSQVLQVTDDDNSVSGLQIDNGEIVWLQGDGTAPSGIYSYTGSGSPTLRNSSSCIDGPFISDGQIVWTSRPTMETDKEIYTSGSGRLTTDSYNNDHVDIDGDYIVWEGDGHVWIHNGSYATWVPDSTQASLNYVKTDGGDVVWSNDQNLYLYDGSATVEISDTVLYPEKIYNPLISNGQVVWSVGEFAPGVLFDLYFHNGAETSVIANNCSLWDFDIDNGNVVWAGEDGNDTEIFLYDGSEIRQLTDNDYDDVSPKICDGQIVWYSMVDGGSQISFAYETGVVFTYYDGTDRIETKVITPFDDDGFVYLHYADTELNLVDETHLGTLNDKGEIAFKYFYYADTDAIHYTEAFSDLDLSTKCGKYTYDIDGNLEEWVTYYAGTDKIETRTLGLPDPGGAIYFKYFNEDWGSQGYGRVDYKRLQLPNAKNELVLEYEYYPDSEQAHYVYSYSDHEMTRKLMTYEYDTNGELLNTWYEYGDYLQLPGSSAGVECSINSNGDIAWRAGVAGEYDIFFYDAETQNTTQISTDHIFKTEPKLSNEGDIVWYQQDASNYDVFYYNADDQTIVELSAGHGSAWEPQINANGDVVWYSGDYDIYYYDSETSSATNLTNSPAANDTSPQINVNGDVVWTCGGEIYLYKKSTGVTSNISGSLNNNANTDPQINSNGDVVWCGTPYYGNKEIFYYDSAAGSVVKVRSNQYTYPDRNDYNPKIGDNGYVTWIGNNSEESPPANIVGEEIFVWDGTSVIQLTDNNYQDMDPQINADGDVVWCANSSTRSVYLYDHNSIQRISDDTYAGQTPQINANGEIVWQGYNLDDNGIFITRPQYLMDVPESGGASIILQKQLISETGACDKSIEIYYDKVNDLRTRSAGGETTIGLLDSGLDLTQSKFNILGGYDFAGSNSFDGFTDYDFSDILGHGTKTGSILVNVAQGSNLLAVKVLDDTGRTTSSVLSQAIKWSVDMGAKILALPLTLDPVSSQLKNAIEYAIGKGAILIAAAGNEGKEIKDTTLAAQEGIITVGAVDNDGKLSAWSNYGDEVDLYAPWDVLETEGEAGTSFSAAFVAGITSLMLSDNPNMTREEVLGNLNKLMSDIQPNKKVNEIKGVSVDEVASKNDVVEQNQSEFTGYSPIEDLLHDPSQP